MTQPTHISPCILVLALIGALSCHGVLAQESSVPVTVGGSKRLAACPERATVERRPHIALMSEPDAASRASTSLAPGTQLFVCDRHASWLGVVVAAVEPAQCGVSLAIERREPYRGGCISGWVQREDVVIKTSGAR
jgi:hypothetical protein